MTPCCRGPRQGRAGGYDLPFSSSSSTISFSLCSRSLIWACALLTELQIGPNGLPLVPATADNCHAEDWSAESCAPPSLPGGRPRAARLLHHCHWPSSKPDPAQWTELRRCPCQEAVGGAKLRWLVSFWAPGNDPKTFVWLCMFFYWTLVDLKGETLLKSSLGVFSRAFLPLTNSNHPN